MTIELTARVIKDDEFEARNAAISASNETDKHESQISGLGVALDPRIQVIELSDSQQFLNQVSRRFKSLAWIFGQHFHHHGLE